MSETDQSTAADRGSECNDLLGLVERLRGRVVTRWVHATGQAPHADGYKADELCLEAADEIERLWRLLRQPARGHRFAGWFSELPSGMSYRLWEQGGHDPDPDEVPLYF